MHTKTEFNLLAFQIIKGSPIVSESPPRSQTPPIVMKIRVPPCMITRSNFEFPWLDMRGAKTMGMSPVFHQSVFFFINLFSLQEMSKEKVTKGHQKVFQDDWLDNPQFKPWLSRVKNEKLKFWCNVKVRINVSWFGKYVTFFVFHDTDSSTFPENHDTKISFCFLNLGTRTKLSFLV